jgi:hypothetical protein
MFIPVWGPLGADLTSYACQVALIRDELGEEPADTDYHPGEWVDGEATLKPPGGGSWGGDFPDGEYMAWVRVVAPPVDEDVRMKAGRVRIGELGDIG